MFLLSQLIFLTSDSAAMLGLGDIVVPGIKFVFKVSAFLISCLDIVEEI